MSKKTRERRAKRKAKRDRIESYGDANLSSTMSKLDRIYSDPASPIVDVIETFLSLTPGTLIFWNEIGFPDDVGALIYPTFDESVPKFAADQIVAIKEWTVAESKLLLMNKAYLKDLVGSDFFELACSASKEIAGHDRLPMFGYWCERYVPLVADRESYEVFGSR